MRRRDILAILAAGAALAAAPAAASAQTTDETAAIRATAEDYILGWYTGDAERMARALHPELVKRIQQKGPAGDVFIDTMGKSRLVMGTRAGGGTKTPEAERRADIRVLDVFGDAAVVRIDANAWVDYLQLVRVDGRWQILNVLWELRPRDGSPAR